MQKKLVLALTATSALALAACAKKAPEELPPPPPTATPAPTPAPTPTPTGPVPGTQAHFSQAMSGKDTIYFDLDKYDIDAQDQAALRAQAQYLMQYSNIRATVEGHCDERGTREYNLALGERRANAAKNYLVSLGVPATRLTVVSYGKERPIALGSNEEAWAQNRRAVTIVLN
ncbi:peptidoglycan-associated lipoprotein [Altererythrobacter atlanticus]|uniref:Peptidoglycan-associated lipoprotein n=1 Tax=Croceibacterium atlanticum TaxID=1267766 RepID=A0A0F7KXZ8_9SPHN|nr:peptidoglycan-associated lipoprotein Pal [Croceibacterium atlanticum]AKH44092.1 Outer membrane lipoprotein Omp16 precursor [Croceibacterium atlanticum]MBB5732402.1 peptidoglycan-associated lipoprotein [Croceibacterium atlanticum]